MCGEDGGVCGNWQASEVDEAAVVPLLPQPQALFFTGLKSFGLEGF